MDEFELADEAEAPQQQTNNEEEIENDEEQQATTSNGHKQNQASEFSKGLLASMASSGTRKRTTMPDRNGIEDEQSTPKRKLITNGDADNYVEEEYQRMLNNPRICSYLIKSEQNCNHEVVLPFDMEYKPLVQKTGDPAKTYEFKLDMFQKQAIKCLDNEQSVLVSAHTSAGKTVVALYAIALALRHKQRVIYTSPIKALSNQKYRELAEEFDDVGLVTGDVTLNPNASCVVMTTEILRSMLYRGSEIMREVGWVIFDEIHYMRDKERGVVWEETIILLPESTHYVFLSATIPNAKQFAEWICYLHHQPCHVVYTDKRPVPLQHLIFPAGGDGLYEVVDDKGNFKQENFQKAMGFLAESQPADGNNRGTVMRRSFAEGQSNVKNVVKIIRTLKERDMLPCIIFSFSRKECELYASHSKEMDLNTEEEKDAIKLIFKNAIDALTDEDKELPHIKNMRPLLMRGVGVHHSGQLPIMKEIVEILFGEGLIKTLFATETFAMGVNMPAKTVLFTSARKFDGTTNRFISGGEYIQMSGRAGRRGKDKIGLVILMMDTQMGADQAMQLVKGTSDPLNSQFRLTYNMVLNLLRVPDINPEYMLEKSFHQWQNYSSLPNLLRALHDKHVEVENIHVDCEAQLKSYVDIEKSIQNIKKTLKSKILTPAKVIPFFKSGRMLKLRHFDRNYDWGTLINWKKTPNPLDPLSPENLYIVEVGVLISPESEKNLPNLSMVRPPTNGERGVLCILPFTFECITAISTIRLKVPEELNSREARESLALTLSETKKRFKGIIPELDPIGDMKISDPQVKRELELLCQSEQRYRDHPIRKRSNFDELYQTYLRKLKLQEEYKLAKKQFEDAQKLLQKEELQCRKRVLRRMGFATEEDTITDKGRVACELSSADELLLTEMIFEGAFTELTPSESAALLSCFVFEERVPNTKLDDKMCGYLRNMQNKAKHIAKISNECKLELDEDKYVEKFNSGMMVVVHHWCEGWTFADLINETSLFEGSIIRCMRRLEELLQEMVNAAKTFGEKRLEEKFETARKMLRRERGIVFSASLYL